MIKYMTLLMIILNIQNSHSGDGVGNGGGISENNFVFAYYNIGSFLKYAKDLPSIEFERKELETTEKIINSLKDEYKLKKPLVFLSGNKYPNIFIHPFNEVRIAVTASKVGSPIYINTDLLYRVIDNQIEYITISQAVSIITHELGHHQAIKDELFLNTLGTKISRSIYRKFEKRKFRDYQDIYFEYINLGATNRSQLLISDSLNTFDLTKELREKVKCPLPSNNEPLGVEIWQSHWTKRANPNWYLKNELIVYCKFGSETRPVAGFDFYIIPEFIKSQNKILIKSVKTYITQCDFRSSSCMAKQQDVLNFIETNNNNIMEEK